MGDELDGTARTALDALFEEFTELLPARLSVSAAVERLRDAVVRLSTAADRPRPGQAHVAHYRAGGFSGRRHTFVVGLDEARVPGPDLEDPVLLDEERRRINEESAQRLLVLGRERPREAAAAFWACLGRLRGNLMASYPSFDLRNLSQAGEPAASPAFLDLYRERSGRAGGDYADLARALPRAAGFAPSEDAVLDEAEWWLSRLRDAGATGRDTRLAPAVRAAYPWLEDGHRAQEARGSDEFTVWDGWIRSGTPELDPRRGGEPFSPSRLQDSRQVPVRLFPAPRAARRRAQGPRARSHPLARADGGGSLLHEVFRDFFQKITEAGEKPQTARHLELILELAEKHISAWKDRIPPRSELAFALQCEGSASPAARSSLARRNIAAT